MTGPSFPAASYLSALDSLIPVSRPDLDNNGRFVGDDAPFNFLPTIPADRIEVNGGPWKETDR
jgi:hypothetical protein